MTTPAPPASTEQRLADLAEARAQLATERAARERLEGALRTVPDQVRAALDNMLNYAIRVRDQNRADDPLWLVKFGDGRVAAFIDARDTIGVLLETIVVTALRDSAKERAGG